MALVITAPEFARSQQARTEVRTIMTEGTSGGGSVGSIMSAGDYDAVGAPTPNFNEAIALAAVRALSRLPVLLPQYAKTALPSAADNVGAMIYVTNDAGGAVPAFSDGVNWRRVTDRNVIS